MTSIPACSTAGRSTKGHSDLGTALSKGLMQHKCGHHSTNLHWTDTFCPLQLQGPNQYWASDRCQLPQFITPFVVWWAFCFLLLLWLSSSLCIFFTATSSNPQICCFSLHFSDLSCFWLLPSSSSLAPPLQCFSSYIDMPLCWHHLLFLGHSTLLPHFFLTFQFINGISSSDLGPSMKFDSYVILNK